MRLSMKSKPVGKLPYRVKIYINNQVLLPAMLVRALGFENAKYADIVIRFGNEVIEVRNAKLLRTRHTSARQFTIPREIRERYGIKPLDEIEILEIKPKNLAEVVRELEHV